MMGTITQVAFVAHTKLLHIKRLNKTKSTIFIRLCVFCFQTQPFRFLLYKFQIQSKEINSLVQLLRGK